MNYILRNPSYSICYLFDGAAQLPAEKLLVVIRVVIAVAVIVLFKVCMVG